MNDDSVFPPRANWFKRNWPELLLGVVVAACLTPTAKRVFSDGQELDPLADFFLNIFLTAASLWIGFRFEMKRAVGQANAKWLPAAESIIMGLCTLSANVRRMHDGLTCNCDQAETLVPELKKQEFEKIRLWVKMDCSARAEQMKAVSDEIENAIDDWERFVQANCSDEECSRIYQAIADRRNSYLPPPKRVTYVPKEVSLPQTTP